MTPEQFDEFIEKNAHIAWTPARLSQGKVEGVGLDQATGLAFKVDGVAWYDQDGNVAFISKEKTGRISPQQLGQELVQGLELEHITRITGYFTKVASWNKGKLGELRDRYRNDGLQRA
jgi:hypothetical protein